MLAALAGEVGLAIPKLFEGLFFPSLLHPRRRVDRALYGGICQAWIDGVSTWKVDQLVCALGNDTGLSRSTVSRICSEIDEAVQEFLYRRIDHIWFPYLVLDATYLEVRVRGLKVATVVDPLGVVLVTSDAHVGIKAVVKVILPGSGWQCCGVHFARTVAQRLGSSRSVLVNALISMGFAQTAPDAVIG